MYSRIPSLSQTVGIFVALAGSVVMAVDLPFLFKKQIFDFDYDKKYDKDKNFFVTLLFVIVPCHIENYKKWPNELAYIFWDSMM